MAIRIIHDYSCQVLFQATTQICLVLSFYHISLLSVCLKVRILWSVPWLWASVLNKHWQSMTCLCVTLYCSSIQHWLNLSLSCVCSSHALPPDEIRRQTIFEQAYCTTTLTIFAVHIYGTLYANVLNAWNTPIIQHLLKCEHTALTQSVLSHNAMQCVQLDLLISSVMNILNCLKWFLHYFSGLIIWLVCKMSRHLYKIKLKTQGDNWMPLTE